MKVIVYTDGSSRGNPGPGGYGAVLRYTAPSGKLHTLELSRGYDRTTNNRMELLGVISALEALNRPLRSRGPLRFAVCLQRLQPALGRGMDPPRMEDLTEKASQERRPLEAPARRQGTPQRVVPLGKGTCRPRVQRALRRARHEGRRRRESRSRHGFRRGRIGVSPTDEREALVVCLQ